jgi:hypothetical protein
MAGLFARPRLARIGALMLAASCGGKQPDRSPTVPVSISPAVRIDAPALLAANGVVEPVQTVAVEAQVGGTLGEVGFRDDVDPGHWSRSYRLPAVYPAWELRSAPLARKGSACIDGLWRPRWP